MVPPDHPRARQENVNVHVDADVTTADYGGTAPRPDTTGQQEVSANNSAVSGPSRILRDRVRAESLCGEDESQQTGRAKERSRIPRFGHTFDGTGDWSAFLAIFEIEASMSAWDDYEASLALLESLTGSAMGVILSIPPQ